MYLLKDMETGEVYPADRCVWHDAEKDGSGYFKLTTAAFYCPGGRMHPLEKPVLGYIGKSGKFIAISE